jgi:nucleoside-diphosphate-sugar epimerase
VTIICTGSSGFLGKHLVNRLQQTGQDLFLVSSSQYDLRDEAQVKRLFEHAGQIDTVYHLAALVGGIGANQLHPARFFYENMRIGMNVVHHSMLAQAKVVCVGSTCSYPKFAPTPFREHALFDGYPEETNAPYGIAKRALWTMLKAYQDEHGLRFAYVIPTNLYGEGDNFDDNTSHVIPALIKKCLNATDSIEVWGTGRATRDFLYVKDAAEGIALAGEKFDSFEPLNLGSGQEISISLLLHWICKATGFDGEIRFDTSKPDGQPRRCLSSANAATALGWKAETKLWDGLKATVEWYKNELTK